MQLASMVPGCTCSFSEQVFLGKRMRIAGDYEPASPVGKWHIHRGDAKLKLLAPPLVAAVIALSPICNPPAAMCVGQAIDVKKGATLFQKACIGCHDAGGNIIQPGATLFFKDLQRNGVDTEEEIYRVTYYGKGRMPGFGENCSPRGQCTFGPRLGEDEIKLLAEFVKSQADRGWPNVQTQGD